MPMVPIGIRQLPRRSPSSRTTASVTRPSRSTVMKVSMFWAEFDSEGMITAPSWTNALHRSGSRFHTLRSKPLCRSRLPMDSPSKPVPSRAMEGMESSRSFAFEYQLRNSRNGFVKAGFLINRCYFVGPSLKDLVLLSFYRLI
jgi:hypothetical protein